MGLSDQGGAGSAYDLWAPSSVTPPSSSPARYESEEDYLARLLASMQAEHQSHPPQVAKVLAVDQGDSVLMVLLPLLIVLSTLLFLVLVFLICVLVLKKKRGIRSVQAASTPTSPLDRRTGLLPQRRPSSCR